MYLVVTDHKTITPGDLPKTRPMVAGCKLMARHLAGFISDIVEALADCMKNPMEAISTEDMLAIVEDYNAKVLSGFWGEDFDPEELVLLGADVVSLFPSMDTTEVAREIRKELEETELRITEVDWKSLALYIALNMNQTEVKSKT